MNAQGTASAQTGFYAPVNGIRMYYEIHGSGQPLILIHGGGSTIDVTFGNVIGLFATSRKVIGVELQGHGRTSERDTPYSFEQDADDVAALIKYLKLEKADIFGFSNGGSTALQVAIRHPELVNKLVIGSGMFKRDGAYPEFWEFMKEASIDNMPQPLKDAYLKVHPDPKGLVTMHDKDVERMRTFKDMKEEDIKSIQAPALIISGDQDIIRPEHAVEMMRLMPNARLAILPGGHGVYIGEMIMAKEGSKLPEMTVAIIEEFLNSRVGK